MPPFLRRAVEAVMVTGAAALGAQLFAQAAEPRSIAASLREGGYVIVMRHGATDSSTADAEGLDLDDPASIPKQRQLSERGRQVARDIGAAFTALSIPLHDVYSSKFQRAVETARAVSGKEPIATLEVSQAEGLTDAEGYRRAAALRRIASTPPAPGANTLVVTHKPNIADAFGKSLFDVREGEASIFKPDGNGKYVLVQRVQADRWAELAKLP
jgi:phosphohistidine phosphatase SixA